MSGEGIGNALQRLVGIGATSSDTAQERAFKSTHVVITTITAPVVAVWSVMYALLGLFVSAAIPLIYVVGSGVGLVLMVRTGRFRLFRSSQMAMWLVLPFLLQWSLGGFANGSAVAMWALGSPLLASLVGALATPWFVGFSALAALSGLIDGSLRSAAPYVPQTVITGMFVANFLGIAFILFIALRFFIRERERSRLALELEQEKSERLLLNILPEDIAARLKRGEEVIADRVEGVTILFADLVGSTSLSEQLSPSRWVEFLNEIFSSFDDLVDRMDLEKIKTIGDAYMVVGGLPNARPDHVEAVADVALAMDAELAKHSLEGVGSLEMRYGFHTGSVVAGVIGKRKFSYDLWGDTVNTAARMESQGVPGEIQTTEAVYQKLRDRYRFTARGPLEVKGKGFMETYFLEGKLGSEPD